MLKMYSNTPLNNDKQALQREPAFVNLGGNRLFFISLGCPRNLVDSEVMLGILLQRGYELTEEITRADFIVINTCSFLKASREESLDHVHLAMQERKATAKVIVTGCMVQSHQDLIRKNFPQVDYLLGSADVEEILAACQSVQKEQSITSARSYLESGEVPRKITTPKHYAYLKIAEGCRKACSYCIIPKIKGPLRSKKASQVCREFRALLKQGVQEIVLIAQDLGDWGCDMGYSKSEGLLFLLQEILKIPGDYWLRLMYLYPDEISDALIALMKKDARICPYLDMPIQHVNDELLKKMRRQTSKEQVTSLIKRLRSEVPDISIRTSLIVGFPGETESHFQELVDFVKKYSLDQVGVFKYSKEKLSASFSLTGHVSKSVKNKRYQTLMRAQQKSLKKNLKQKIGKRMEVVVETYHPESSLLALGRHRGQCPEVDGQVIINNVGAVKAFGKRHWVEISDFSSYDLVGSIVS